MIEFIVNHKAELFQVLTGVVTVASIIVKLTPSSKDDAFLMKILKVLSLNK